MMEREKKSNREMLAIVTIGWHKKTMRMTRYAEVNFHHDGQLYLK